MLSSIPYALWSQVRLQRPTVSAEMSFLLAVLKFYVPSAASSGATPIPFHSEDILLTGRPVFLRGRCFSCYQEITKNAKNANLAQGRL